MENDTYSLLSGKDAEILEALLERSGELERFRRLVMQYECAMLEVKTKLDVLNAQLSLAHSRNPFETIKCRIKTPGSILEKLNRNGIPLSIANVKENLNDIAGVRVIYSFPDDIYMLADCLLAQDDIVLIEKKDYIKNPKPIFLTDEKKMMRVEVQFRTIAMDFWASLEHKIKYKKHVAKPESISEELFYCAELIAQLDGRMQQIRQKIENSAEG